MRIDVSDVEGLNKLFSISPSSLGNISSEVKVKVKIRVVKKENKCFKHLF